MDADVFDAHGARRRPVLIEPASQGDAAAQPRFAVLGEDAVVVVAAQAQTVLAVEEKRLAEADRVALQLRAGHRFGPELLPAAAEGPPAQQILEAGRRPKDVEVP